MFPSGIVWWLPQTGKRLFTWTLCPKIDWSKSRYKDLISIMQMSGILSDLLGGVGEASRHFSIHPYPKSPEVFQASVVA
ncbi:hypothetical protein I79_005666 [Cricetulus griseus]|uniref:Uncharacterized protein n=1 Tax=Cricetulus griseus TaxID=10029 RepID=G3H5S6_CRIGR|nr:hypothetical protein I79_005666 [Cricetulus griseus]